MFRKPESSWTLRTVQAIALAEIHDFDGLFAPIQVGGGKTLISYLAPLVVEAKRPLLLVPARLREKTWDDHDRYRKQWRLPALECLDFQKKKSYPDNIRVTERGKRRALVKEGDSDTVLVLRSYAYISRNPDFLDEYQPDLIISDECQRLSNKKSAVGKRVCRYIRANKTRCAFLSGTVARRSIQDWAHLAELALGLGSPAPIKYGALSEWASYLDEGVESPPQPGALVRLVEDQEALLRDPKTAIRTAFGKRLESTPGVVSVRGRGCQASLQVSAVRHKIQDQTLLDALSTTEALWALPDGQEFADSTELARHMRTLSLGYYQRWIEPGPEKWMEARRNWCKFVRHSTKGSKYDTELQVARACDSGALHSDGIRAAWLNVRDTFQPRTVCKWVSEDVVLAAIEHIRSEKNPSLVWVQSPALAKKLHALTRWRVFGQGSKGLEKYLDKSSEHAILTIGVNSDGKNLQKRNRSVVLEWPRTGRTVEQLIGRTHREPTDHDHVQVDALIATRQQHRDLLASYRDAMFLHTTTPAEQKLIFADKQGWKPNE
jgi:hypothetical protein